MNVTQVTFKTETYLDGVPAGPVTLFDEAAYNADPVIAERRAKGLLGMPYGHQPQGMRILTPWVTVTEAHAIARSHNVPLTEV